MNWINVSTLAFVLFALERRRLKNKNGCKSWHCSCQRVRFAPDRTCIRGRRNQAPQRGCPVFTFWLYRLLSSSPYFSPLQNGGTNRTNVHGFGRIKRENPQRLINSKCLTNVRYYYLGSQLAYNTMHLYSISKYV